MSDSSSGGSAFSGSTLGVAGGAAGTTGVVGAGTVGIPHNPEPITMALFGSGLAAFAISKKRKKAACN